MENLWARRTNSTKLSLSTTNNGANGGVAGGDSSSSATGTRSASFAKRFGDASSHGGKSNPFDSLKTPGGSLASPSASSASNAFGLGSGAFASFGSAKTPKTPGNPFELGFGAAKTADKSSAVGGGSFAAPGSKVIAKPASMASITETESISTATTSNTPPAGAEGRLRYKWVFWSRLPQASKTVDYEKTLRNMLWCATVDDFVQCYRHLNRPSQMSTGFDYAFFKDGIRPIWEDPANKDGGKWVIRLRKGVADKYWDSILLSLVGDLDWGDVGEDVTGVVLSVRKEEDILSLWIRHKEHVDKIRDILKKALDCPENTRMEFKAHDSSLQQRSAMEARRDRAASHSQHHADGGSTNSKRVSAGLLGALKQADAK